MSTSALATRPQFDMAARWELDPQVAIRPERFGALLYHFGTRRLSFVKTPILLAVLQALAGAPSAHAACDRAGVAESQRHAIETALGTLASSSMIRVRQEIS